MAGSLHARPIFPSPPQGVNFDTVFMLAAEGGAEDVTQDEDIIEIIAPVEAFKTVTDQLRAANIHPEEAELRMVANQEMELSPEETMQVMRCIERLKSWMMCRMYTPTCTSPMR